MTFLYTTETHLSLSDGNVNVAQPSICVPKCGIQTHNFKSAHSTTVKQTPAYAEPSIHKWTYNLTGFTSSHATLPWRPGPGIKYRVRSYRLFFHR